MSAQPLTKSDWDWHPVWWVRGKASKKERMVQVITASSIMAPSDKGNWNDMSFQHLADDGWQRSHDRIHWTPCSREVKPPLQLREGAWYERRDGKIVGPCNWNELVNLWRVGGPNYNYHGLWYGRNQPSEYDLIREVPPPQPCTISKAEAGKHAVTENRVAQPDTVDVEKLIELARRVNRCAENGITVTAVLKALAALHPRLKEEVEK